MTSSIVSRIECGGSPPATGTCSWSLGVGYYSHLSICRSLTRAAGQVASLRDCQADTRVASCSALTLTIRLAGGQWSRAHALSVLHRSISFPLLTARLA